MSLVFDTLKLSRTLGKAFTPEQAEVLTEALTININESLATKAALAAMTAELKAEIAGLDTKFTTEIASVRTEIASVRTEVASVRTEIAELETKLTAKIAELDTRLTAKIAGAGHEAYGKTSLLSALRSQTTGPS